MTDVGVTGSENGRRARVLAVLAVFGPGFSGSMIVSMTETRRAEIPNFTGAEAASITMQGNPYVYRTSFGLRIRSVAYAEQTSRLLGINPGPINLQVFFISGADCRWS